MTGKKAALPVLLHYLLVIAALSMLVDVETFFLDSLVYTQTGNLVDDPEEEKTHYCRPQVYTDYSEELCTEETEAMTIQCSRIQSKESGEQCSEDTTYSMNGTCTYRVVDMKLGINELDCKYKNDSTYQSYNQCP